MITRIKKDICNGYIENKKIVPTPSPPPPHPPEKKKKKKKKKKHKKKEKKKKEKLPWYICKLGVLGHSL